MTIEIERSGHPVAKLTKEVEFLLAFDYQASEQDLGVEESIDITDVWLLINGIKYQLNEVTKRAVDWHLVDEEELFDAIHEDMINRDRR